jgi:UDP-N-acetylmuramate: L-alanyl-gamma-D-glutamyl-meso-diaminopimelate ligase
LHQKEYERAFKVADWVLLAPLGRTNVPEGDRLDVSALAAQIEHRGTRAEAASSVADIVEKLAREAQPGDTIALLSNGAFGGIHQRLLQALAS